MSLNVSTNSISKVRFKVWLTARKSAKAYQSEHTHTHTQTQTKEAALLTRGFTISLGNSMCGYLIPHLLRDRSETAFAWSAPVRKLSFFARFYLMRIIYSSNKAQQFVLKSFDWSISGLQQHNMTPLFWKEGLGRFWSTP